MNTYRDAERWAESHRPRGGPWKLAHNTYLIRAGDAYVVRFHGTDVVTYYPDGRVRLNSGGWRTYTTKRRLNMFGPVPVWAERGEWYVGGARKTLFRDGMLIGPAGEALPDPAGPSVAGGDPR